MELIKLKELAKRTSIEVRTLRYYAKRKGMPNYKIGRTIRVNPEEFEEWLSQFKHSVETKKEAERNLDSLVNDVCGSYR
ncbi:DNA binding domain-containing protein, excisionase family [Desulfatibacillum alkenivorans DSM 16219]|uniref:DNA binding domain-containing protein, excisionase family n=1 Tax=Desulfatibacillum alkenivorans DSM 16219 TaxID=1121393 RepID=A0A1M6LP88_9BACT|nr:helix-turn-helix domain-containing protein [Desulfatibacillum alkenivorans]SHJ73008.1 DNA binding domain-containing protein, excisionase family [Desulfatibacillum alkenivorans DSM 16219]